MVKGAQGKMARLAGAALVAGVATQQVAGVAFALWFNVKPASIRPWTLGAYWAQMGHRRPDVARFAAGGAALSLAAAAGTAAGAAWHLRRRPLHGEARLATRSEIEAADFFKPEGFLIGRLGSRYLYWGHHLHLLLTAPPGTFKTTGFVYTNAKQVPAGVFLDVKRQVYRETAGIRAAAGNRIFVFDPCAQHTHRWNPFFYVPDDHAGRVDEIMKIGWHVSPSKGGSNQYFYDAARVLFLGVSLYLFEQPGCERTLPEVLRMLRCPQGAQQLFSQHLNGIWDKEAKCWVQPPQRHRHSGTCCECLDDFVRMDPRTANAVRSNLCAALEVFVNPMTINAVSGNDFDMRYLRGGPDDEAESHQPMSIYVTVSPDNLRRMGPVLALFFQQMFDLNLRWDADDARFKRPCPVILDEFAILPRMQIILDALAVMRGYGMPIGIIAQSEKQLEGTFGHAEAEAIKELCGLRLAYPTFADAHARHISTLLGTYTVRHRARSGGWGRPHSWSESDKPMPVLSADEIRHLGLRRLIAIPDTCPAFVADKIINHKDEPWAGLKAEPPPIPACPPARPVPPAAPDELDALVEPPPESMPKPAVSVDVSKDRRRLKGAEELQALAAAAAAIVKKDRGA